MKKNTNIYINTSKISIDKKRKILINPIFFISCDLIDDPFYLYSENITAICDYNKDVLNDITFLNDNLRIINFNVINIEILQVIYTFFMKNNLNISKNLYDKLNKKLRIVKINNLMK